MKNETEQPWYEKAAGKKRPRTEKKAKESKKQDEARRNETRRQDAETVHARPAKAATPARRPSAQIKGLFPLEAVPKDAREVLEKFDQIASGVRTMSGKQQALLAGTIKALSHTLTDDRASRRVGYMNDAGAVSAYISYFMWWNLVRLTRLFSSLPKEAFDLSDGDAILDIGSGPLTVPVALWLSRPELRKKQLTVYCMDTSQTALQAGEELFLAVAARTAEPETEPWHIVRVRGALGDNVQIREKAALITSANVFNEIIQTSDMPPDFLAKKYTREILQYAKADGSSLLLIEPGDPKSARFVSLMRDALLRKDFAPLSPCPHSGECPMNGLHTMQNGRRSGKWCNFAFSTEDAPAALKKLSEKAGLPKDRATLSFVLSSNTSAAKQLAEGARQLQKAAWTGGSLPVRITSDIIHLPAMHTTGYYACCELGLLLALDRHHLQPKSGDFVTVRPPKDTAQRDKKSGALITEL
ncbi:MAG: hypothetical protein K6G80_02975 [Treponema sp.]|nr:hypothetical protein [Treponema sp.]